MLSVLLDPLNPVPLNTTLKDSERKSDEKNTTMSINPENNPLFIKLQLLTVEE